MERQREQRFKHLVREICRLFDESQRDPGAVLRIEPAHWKIGGAVGVNGVRHDWCYAFPTAIHHRWRSPTSLARKCFDDYQAEFRAEWETAKRRGTR